MNHFIHLIKDIGNKKHNTFIFKEEKMVINNSTM